MLFGEIDSMNDEARMTKDEGSTNAQMTKQRSERSVRIRHFVIPSSFVICLSSFPHMNQPMLLHIVERLEGLVGKLPEGIRRPILSELTPLKELFLQQRPPRFLFVGSGKLPMPQVIHALFFTGADEQISVAVMPVHRWAEWRIDDHGTITVLDAREADDSAVGEIRDELERQPADLVFVMEDDSDKGTDRALKDIAPSGIKLVGISVGDAKHAAQMRKALSARTEVRDRLLKVIRLGETDSSEATRLMSILTEELPNEAKIEMIRISRDREAQHHVAQILVKSTTAICAAIGAQPIPLADLPILTTLQLVMVSGIMYQWPGAEFARSN